MQLALRLGCPDNRLLAFTFTLTGVVNDGDGDHDNNQAADTNHGIESSFDQYGMHETINNMAHFRLRLPLPGTYRFDIFAADVTDVDQFDVSGEDFVSSLLRRLFFSKTISCSFTCDRSCCYSR